MFLTQARSINLACPSRSRYIDLQSLYIFPVHLPLSRFAYPSLAAFLSPIALLSPVALLSPIACHLSRRLRPPVAFALILPSPSALSLPSPSRSHSRRFHALSRVAFALSYPSPPRSLSRRLSALPPVALTLSLPQPLRSHSRRIRALSPVASALSFPLPPHSLSRRLRALSLPRPSFFLFVAFALSLLSHVSSPTRRLRALTSRCLRALPPVDITLTFLLSPPISSFASSRPNPLFFSLSPSQSYYPFVIPCPTYFPPSFFDSLF
ncbi:unnamed protein product [Closterium sp. NIES-64]|nr:unnamed protein product [Closterium sp. NIES-64]